MHCTMRFKVLFILQQTYYLFHIMVKGIKQILYKSKLVLNSPVNSRHTKLDKSKLVLNNPVNLSWTKLIKSKLVLNNPVNLHQTKLDKSELVLNSPVNSCHKELDKSQLVLNCQFVLSKLVLHNQACRPWGCQGCHGTPNFWPIS
jgi:hypothetical protein